VLIALAGVFFQSWFCLITHAYSAQTVGPANVLAGAPTRGDSVTDTSLFILLAGVACDNRLSVLCYQNPDSIGSADVGSSGAASIFRIHDPAGLIVLTRVALENGLGLATYMDTIRPIATAGIVPCCAACLVEVGDAKFGVVFALVAFQHGLGLIEHPDTAQTVMIAHAVANQTMRITTKD
jgi:hypothetical protein